MGKQYTRTIENPFMVGDGCDATSLEIAGLSKTGAQKGFSVYENSLLRYIVTESGKGMKVVRKTPLPETREYTKAELDSIGISFYTQIGGKPGELGIFIGSSITDRYYARDASGKGDFSIAVFYPV